MYEDADVFSLEHPLGDDVSCASCNIRTRNNNTFFTSKFLIFSSNISKSSIETDNLPRKTLHGKSIFLPL